MKKLIVTLALVLFIVPTTFANTTSECFVASPFDGMWGIDVEGGGVGWLNVHQKQGFLDAELLWIGGSVLPVGNVYLIDDNTLVVTRTHEMKKSSDRTHTMTLTLRIY